MTLKQFIQDNRAELDQCIARALGSEQFEAYQQAKVK